MDTDETVALIYNDEAFEVPASLAAAFGYDAGRRLTDAERWDVATAQAQASIDVIEALMAARRSQLSVQ
jgi:hypothetical protein